MVFAYNVQLNEASVREKVVLVECACVCLCTNRCLYWPECVEL